MKVKGDVEVDGRIKGQTQLPLIAVDNERGPATVNLPKEPQEGDFLIIKDVKGMATVNNITIQGHHSIDGQDRFILTIDREAVHVVFSGKFSDPDEPGQWYVI